MLHLCLRFEKKSKVKMEYFKSNTFQYMQLINAAPVNCKKLKLIVFLYVNFTYKTLNFKLKIVPETCTFKNLEEISQKSVATL